MCLACFCFAIRALFFAINFVSPFFAATAGISIEPYFAMLAAGCCSVVMSVFRVLMVFSRLKSMSILFRVEAASVSSNIFPPMERVSIVSL